MRKPDDFSRTFLLIFGLAALFIASFGACAASAVGEFIETEDTPSGNFEAYLTPSEIDWIRAHRTIRAAIKSGWMPIEFRLENERHSGVSVDYLAAMARLVGIKIQVVEYSENLRADQADVITSVANLHTLENSDFENLQPPFLSIPYAIYVNKNQRLTADRYTLKDLQGLKVAVFRHSKIGRLIAVNYPGIKVINVDIADEGFEKLRLNEVDAYIGNELVVDYHVGVHRLDFIDKREVTPFRTDIYMAVRRNSPELYSILEKALRVIGPDNAAILQKWRIEDKPRQKTFWYAISGLLVLALALLVVRLYRLNRAIRIEKEAASQKIWHQANFDHLTDIPNRYLLEYKIDAAIARAKRSALPIAMLFIDLDNFKIVNDKSGHPIGDAILIETVRRVRMTIRDEDMIARIGGDEFVVVMSELHAIEVIDAVCAKILTEIAQPYRMHGEVYYLSGSIGVSVFPNDSRDYLELLQHADQAMYEAKKQGKNRYQIFNTAINQQALRKINLAHELREALHNRQFELYYQPIVDLHTNTIKGAEGLVRWHHPKNGLVAPAEFIPIAESSGLMEELGRLILEIALRDLPRLRHGGRFFTLNINLSPMQFTDSKPLMAVAEAFSATEHGGGVCFEITESLLLEASVEVLELIRHLKALGFQFAIDDFGTGYSALSYLKKFSIDVVKIDKSFVQNLETSQNDAILCEAIIEMAHRLGIRVTAEGIESAAQLALVRSFQADYGQGYFFSRPLPLDAFMSYLDRHQAEAASRPSMSTPSSR